VTSSKLGLPCQEHKQFSHIYTWALFTTRTRGFHSKNLVGCSSIVYSQKFILQNRNAYLSWIDASSNGSRDVGLDDTCRCSLLRNTGSPAKIAAISHHPLALFSCFFFIFNSLTVRTYNNLFPLVSPSPASLQLRVAAGYLRVARSRSSRRHLKKPQPPRF